MLYLFTKSNLREWWLTYWYRYRVTCNLYGWLLRSLSHLCIYVSILKIVHVTTLSPADWLLQILLLTLQLHTFYKRITWCTSVVFGTNTMLVKYWTSTKWHKMCFASLIQRFYTWKASIYEFQFSSLFLSVPKNWHQHRVFIYIVFCQILLNWFLLP